MKGTCRDVVPLLDELRDGALDDVRARAVRGHLRECAACARRLADLGALCEAAADLGTLDPPAELWAAIGARLDREAVAASRRPRVWWWWHAWRSRLLAGGGAMVLAAGALLIILTRGMQTLEPALAALPRPPASPDELYEQAVHEVVRAETDYDAALRDLREIVAVERKDWKPEVARAFDENLATIDAAVARQSAIARGAPGDPEVADALAASYRREIAFLQEAVVRGEDSVKRLALLLLLAPGMAFGDEEGEFLVERDTVEIAPAPSVKIQRVDIDNRLGDITVIGRDAPGVTLSVVKRGPDEEVLDRLKINLVPDPGDGTVRISSALLVGKEERPVASGTLRVDIKVYAPRGAGVAARAWNGKVGVTGMDNGADISAHDSDIVVTNVHGTVSTTSMRGHQRLSSVSGRVSADHTYGDVALDAIDGDSLAARVHRGTVIATRIRSSRVELTTTFGDIQFRGELAAGGRVELRSYKGNIDARTSGAFNVDAMAPGGAIEPGVELGDAQRTPGRLIGHFGASERPAVLLMKSTAGRVTFGLSQPSAAKP